MKRILIVDDDTVICSLLKTFLSLKKYSVECVNNGTDAVNAVSNGSFDIVVSDMNMYGIDGAALLETMRRASPGIKLIAMSGDTSFDKLPPDLKASMPFIRKPFRLQEIERLIIELGSGDSVT